MIEWREALDFEAVAPTEPTAKASRIRQTFGVSPARYYGALGRAIENGEAALYRPELVARLVRIRDTRRRRRFVAREEIAMGNESAPARQQTLDLDGAVRELQEEEHDVAVGNTEARVLARAGDPDTSHMAAAHVAPRSGRQKERLLAEYRAAYPDGLTDELAALRAHVDPWQASKRCSDLRREGRIEPIAIVMGRKGTKVRVCREVRGGGGDDANGPDGS